MPSHSPLNQWTHSSFYCPNLVNHSGLCISCHNASQVHSLYSGFLSPSNPGLWACCLFVLNSFSLSTSLSISYPASGMLMIFMTWLISFTSVNCLRLFLDTWFKLCYPGACRRLCTIYPCLSHAAAPLLCHSPPILPLPSHAAAPLHGPCASISSLAVSSFWKWPVSSTGSFKAYMLHLLWENCRPLIQVETPLLGENLPCVPTFICVLCSACSLNCMLSFRSL